MKKNKGMLIVFMTPAVVMFVLVFLYPIIRTILMSFFKIEGITDPMSKWTFSGIDNYVKLANTTLFRISMWNLARIWFIGGRYHYQRHPLQELFQGNDLSAEYCQRSGPGDHVASVCLQPQVRTD